MVELARRPHSYANDKDILASVMELRVGEHFACQSWLGGRVPVERGLEAVYTQSDGEGDPNSDHSFPAVSHRYRGLYLSVHLAQKLPLGRYVTDDAPDVSARLWLPFFIG